MVPSALNTVDGTPPQKRIATTLENFQRRQSSRSPVYCAHVNGTPLVTLPPHGEQQL